MTGSVLIIVNTSTLYEVIEWLAALVFGGELGIAFVGAQGDLWDAQKDQTQTISGAILRW